MDNRPSEYFEGLRLYQLGKYWESHEVWETLWRKAEGEKRHFLQALIQLDAALLHTRRSHWKGVSNLLARSIGHLKNCSGILFGIDIRLLLKALDAYTIEIDKLIEGEKQHFDWSHAPKLGIGN